MAAPYLAPSLVRLRASINAAFPKRDKRSDGWIGDRAHANRTSEHNPDSRGCVHAIDVDIDDGNPGQRDLRKELLAATVGHRAVWYVISNGVIYSRTYNWRPRRYEGPNGHFQHVHVSIRLATDAENDATLLLAKPKPAGGAVVGARTLRRGDRGPDVAFVQRFLGITADGIYGTGTEAAVRRYQQMRGIAVDGVVGRNTWANLRSKG
jgi:peptidoglycan hydrolase-like protein with peptidoglycan-binding domain